MGNSMGKTFRKKHHVKKFKHNTRKYRGAGPVPGVFTPGTKTGDAIIADIKANQAEKKNDQRSTRSRSKAAKSARDYANKFVKLGDPPLNYRRLGDEQ